MSHVLPALPWAPSSLAPVISPETIEFHHGKHHQAYVTNLNALLEGTGLESQGLEELLASIDQVPEAKRTGVFNNAAQVWNHTFYWESLTPGGSSPSEPLSAAIDRDFGSFESFRTSFVADCVSNFGSGWTWLVADAKGHLSIAKTSNAARPTGKPLLTCDVWEHAYYIDYRNARPKYAQALFELYDWARVSQRFEA